MFLSKRDLGSTREAPLTFEKKYQIIVEIGTGVNGTVYKVRQKVFRPQTAAAFDSN